MTVVGLVAPSSPVTPTTTKDDVSTLSFFVKIKLWKTNILKVIKNTDFS